MVRRKKKRKSSGRRAVSLPLGEIAGLAIMVGAAFTGENVIARVQQGNFGGAANSLGNNIRANLPQVGLGVGMGIGSRLLRRSGLSPKFRIPKLVTISA